MALIWMLLTAVAESERCDSPFIPARISVVEIQLPVVGSPSVTKRTILLSAAVSLATSVFAMVNAA
ncbi:hypothetical protein D3C84_855790 [compost metagenome]